MKENLVCVNADTWRSTRCEFGRNVPPTLRASEKVMVRRCSKRICCWGKLPNGLDIAETTEEDAWEKRTKILHFTSVG
jgi:hypothetical protein